MEKTKIKLIINVENVAIKKISKLKGRRDEKIKNKIK